MPIRKCANHHEQPQGDTLFNYSPVLGRSKSFFEQRVILTKVGYDPKNGILHFKLQRDRKGHRQRPVGVLARVCKTFCSIVVWLHHHVHQFIPAVINSEKRMNVERGARSSQTNIHRCYWRRTLGHLRDSLACVWIISRRCDPEDAPVAVGPQRGAGEVDEVLSVRV